MKKIRPIKNACYDWLISYVPEPIRKSVGGFKDKIVSFFKTNTPKKSVYGRRKKPSKPKKQNKRNPFISKENKKNQRYNNWRYLETLRNRRRKKRNKEIGERKNLMKDSKIN